MKKLILTALLSASTLAAFGQGQINVDNLFKGSFVAPIFGVNPADPSHQQTGAAANMTGTIPTGGTVYGGAALQGPGYSFGFYAGATSVNSLSGMQLLTVLPFRTSTGANVLPAGTVLLAGGLAVPGISAGVACNFIIAAWDNKGGTLTSYAQAFAAGADSGFSAVTTSGLLGGTDASNAVFTVPNSVGFQSFSLVSVPEPGTLALAGLGAASLLLFRRKK
jgi:hypothetical protein